MFGIWLAVLFAVVGVQSSGVTFAQGVTYGVGLDSVRASSPIQNAPYSAKRRFTSSTKQTNGSIVRDESGGSEARDSMGRTYWAGERKWTYFDGKKNVLKSEMLYRIEDPVANTYTTWDTSSNVAKVVHFPPPRPKTIASEEGCQSACGEDAMGASAEGAIEELGAKTINGVVVNGTKSSYVVPGGQDHNDQSITVVHESWYCPELKIVILETNDDPRSGTTRDELIDIVRGEPDVTQYRPPADYVVREIQMPSAIPPPAKSY